ncbi:5-cytosine rRNA methyltransferase NSUN4 [Aplochiton taeniatus]
MAALINTRLLLRKIKDLRCLNPRRTRIKAKWAGSQPKYPATNMALQHFDATYSLQLANQWPSVRVSLLCEQKYGALINSLSVPDAVLEELRDQGCEDFVSNRAQSVLDGVVEGGEPGLMKTEVVEPCLSVVGGDVSSSHHLSVGVGQEQSAPLRLSPDIKVFVFPRGDISRFKPSRPDKYGLLGYYLMDAASILPVLALDVQEGHAVLDLCAAPGGKALAMLQNPNIRYLCVNDVSVSRSIRLQRVLQSYVPKELLTDQKLRVSSIDGTKWGEFERSTFDRVLVDVPCTTDRHSVIEEENNIFKRVRSKERQRLPQLQMQLLLAGIEAARPSGEIVYSTCSLSQLQNQYVVEQAIHLAQAELNIRLQVVDLRPLTYLFRNTFQFAADLHLGELVLPQLDANFGPIYMCKLRRLS